MTLIIYGIKNCDTVKKSTVWFDQHAVGYTFHDFKKEGLDKKTLLSWKKQVGLEKLINKKSATYRGLSDAEKLLLEKEVSALPVILAHPTLLKRPIVEVAGIVKAVGFEESKFVELTGI